LPSKNIFLQLYSCHLQKIMLKITPELFSYRPYWAKHLTPAPFLPMSMDELIALEWYECDIIIVTGDAYVDHPSFGMAVIGRVLEAQGFRVGIIAQPNWKTLEDFQKLGAPKLFFGVTGGNMDSMVNRYTADKRRRSDDAYTPDAAADKRPDRAVSVYCQKLREAFPEVPIVIGGIEASLRRIAHYDYWADRVMPSLLVETKADLLIYGNAERAVVEVAHRLANGESIDKIDNLRGTAFLRRQLPEDYTIIDSSDLDVPGRIDPIFSPYTSSEDMAKQWAEYQATLPNVSVKPLVFRRKKEDVAPEKALLRLPDFEAVRENPVLYAHASRVFHLETNPGNAKSLIQKHGKYWLWQNPPPIPLETKELDQIFELPYQRLPHPAYGQAKIPAYEMIRFSVNIMRGCFGGCTFCSITEHEGRIIQSRSEDSVVREIETIRDAVPGFTGVISDIGGPTANMYRIACKSKAIESKCRRLSCVFPDICSNLNTDHTPLIQLYRRVRALPGIKKVVIASGLRYDLAMESPEYIKELVEHHVGGYLKIAPEHTEMGPLQQMMKPGMGKYYGFKELFEKYSKAAGKKQYLIPYFIAAHPGTTDTDMLNLALWLKENNFRADQVQTFLPSPMALATAMYHSGKNPLKKVTAASQGIETVKDLSQRRLHKAFLRYHDPKNWPLLRQALRKMGRSDLIGNGKQHLIPHYQPVINEKSADASTKTQVFTTQHLGLPKNPKRVKNTKNPNKSTLKK
jgi:uncharacterized radical SAM protein YgiQ